MIDLGYSRYAALRGPFRSGLMFLFHLAWKSRIRLPVLIAIGLMALDIRMQLEININLGRAAGRQNVPLLGQDNGQDGIIDLDDTDTDSDDTYAVEDGDSDSYTTDSYTLHSGYSSDNNGENDNEESNNHLFSSTCPESENQLQSRRAGGSQSGRSHSVPQFRMGWK